MSVYLDYNATTPLAAEVLEVTTAALRDAWANPNSSHEAGEASPPPASNFVDYRCPCRPAGSRVYREGAQSSGKDDQLSCRRFASCLSTVAVTIDTMQ